MSFGFQIVCPSCLYMNLKYTNVILDGKHYIGKLSIETQQIKDNNQMRKSDFIQLKEKSEGEEYRLSKSHIGI